MAKKKATHQPFEGNSPSGPFTKITTEMMTSLAWKELSLRQRGLYLIFKSKYRQKMSSGRLIQSNKDDISLPRAEWLQYYGDYRTFKEDINMLLSLGFITLVQSGKATRTCNIYGFDDKWKGWKPAS